MLGPSDAMKDEFFAPNLSAFKTANIPDMSQRDHQSEAWLVGFSHNSMLRGRASSPDHEYRFTFLRRAVIAFAEHADARMYTLRYLGFTDEFRPATYYAALYHWEQFLGASWHALDTMTTMYGPKVFTKKDATAPQRLNSLYNQSRHAASCIASGHMPSSGPLPMWLDNDGLRSVDSDLSFAETADVLVFLGEWAHALEDPPSTEERVQAMLQAHADRA